MIAALATSHKIGLIVVAGLFISFALVSAFVLPARRPDFPGKHLRLFIAVTVALFVAMLAAVVIFGSEPKEKRDEAAATSSTSTSTSTTAAPASSADADAGKTLFASKGCGGCHSIDGTFIAGPSLKGVAGSKVTLADGSTVTADDAYLTESIEDPGAKIVKCPNCGPPSPMLALIKPGSVSKDDAAKLVAYIKTLK